MLDSELAEQKRLDRLRWLIAIAGILAIFLTMAACVLMDTGGIHGIR